jgi:signal transduction histidine kinase/ActR/RegA family two-component response regulator
MRLLVVFLLVLFGAYAQSLRDKLERPDVRRQPRLRRLGMVYYGAAFGGLYWILEAVRDVVVFDKGDLFSRIVKPDLVTVFMRLLAICIMLLFSVYAQKLFEEREKAKLELQKAHDDLEDLVQQRTAELIRSNTLLKKEIEEKRIIEDELLKVNRALKTLSQCNEVMVRAVEEGALLSNICKTIVYTGGYQVAWVGFSAADGTRKIRLASHAGLIEVDQGAFIAAVENASDDDLEPIREVIRTGQPKALRFTPAESGDVAWRKVAAERGFAASLVLPLGTGDKPVGVLNIVTTEADAFDSGEVDLLQELADDLAFGITALRTHAERKRAEEEKEKIQAQLLQSQKMEAVGVLAGGVAHDFNNLLTAIQVSADLGMLEIGESNPVHKILREIHQVASHAGDVARQLLLFSRKHPMEYMPMNLNGTVENLRRMLTRLIGEDIDIQTQVEPGLSNVMADHGTMEQVLMNLALNARDAMPNGGMLLIETSNSDVSESDAESVAEARPGRFVRLRVKDSGSGIASDVLPHIFEPFFSTKGPGKGTGLGLSVVYGIVQQHGGWITVTTKVGQGSCFDVYLPAVHDLAEAPRTDASQKTAAVGGRGERILLVEDEKRVQEYTAKALVKSGYAVFEASDAEEALALFNREGGKFDLLFSDVVLPDLSGIELAERLRTKNPKIKILISSGYTDQKSQWPVILEKGFRFLQKPYALTELLKTLREVLDKGSS